MFVLLTLKDTIPVAPKAFGIAPAVTITDAINKKYANRLIQDKGLALSCFDILSAEDGKVTWGNGLMYYKTTFRLLLFAPFVGEVINGRVMYTTPKYIRISLDFFQDIYITPSSLPPNSTYDPVEKRFFFYWADDSDTTLSPAELFSTVKAERLYIDDGEPFKFRVESLDWQDIKPEPPNIETPAPKVAPKANGAPNGVGKGAPNGVANGVGDKEEAMGNGDAGSSEAEGGKGKDPFDMAGWKIFGNIGESGLGVMSWWNGAGAGGDEGVEEEEAMMQE